jgi:amino acid permease
LPLQVIRPSLPRLNIIIGTSGAITCTINLVIALGSYLTYGALVSKDVLEAYPGSNLITVIRVFMSLLVTFTYPRKLSAIPCYARFVCYLLREITRDEPEQ